MDTIETINFDKLQKEFHNAKLAEERYKLENDAKFRAVHQKVSTYEEFRDIVASSHLQPLERRDIYHSNKINQPWNSFYSPKLDHESQIFECKRTELSHSINNCDQFNKAWKCIECPRTKCDFLLKMEESNVKKIFRCDIPSNVLETCLEQFTYMLTDENCSPIIRILTVFAASQRFNIALRFLQNREKEFLAKLFVSLETHHQDVKLLKASYGL